MENEIKTRNKTSQKLKYEAEASVIESKIGGIEEVRLGLGLSQRKMSQLLMVDPSAWTRWSSGQTPVPPHVYRSLQWYLALIEKNPEWHPQNSFMKAFQDTNATDLKRSLESHRTELNAELKNLKEDTQNYLLKNKTNHRLTSMLTLLCLLQMLLILFIFLK